MPFWMCALCGLCLEALRPPDPCPHCQQTCSFRDVTCYRPECGGEQNVDPLLTSTWSKGVITRDKAKVEQPKAKDIQLKALNERR